MKAGQPKFWFGAENAAHYLGYSVRHFRRVAEEEEILPTEIGRGFFWTRPQLDKLKAKKRAHGDRRGHGHRSHDWRLQTA